MDDVRIGNTIRMIRIRKRLRQSDVARRARTTRQVVSRLEQGALGRYPLDTICAVAGALGVRMELRARWHGADLDRVTSAAHAALHGSVARHLGTIAGWTWVPEVSFSIYGERGVIDILAFHPLTRSLLIIELKTELVDPQDLVATMHRRVRLGTEIAASQGWEVGSVSAWVIVADTRTQRRRRRHHAALLDKAFPQDGRSVRGWLRQPAGAISALSFWTDGTQGRVRPDQGPVQRVRAADPRRIHRPKHVRERGAQPHEG